MRARFHFWTASQQRALLSLCVILLAILVIEQWRKPVVLSDPLPVEAPRESEIDDRIDPNTADAAELSAIPNLGEIKAGEIVTYRQNFVRQHPGKVAFRSVEDLENIKGIGVATAGNLENYLVFPKK